jgi:hypothetical protein
MRVFPIALLALPIWLPAQDHEPAIPKIPALPTRSARVQRYTMTAQLREDARQLQTTCRLEFDNPSPAAITDLEFHLYWNGWKNSNATWLAESSRGLGRRSERKVRNDSFAALDIKSMALVGQGVRENDRIANIRNKPEDRVDLLPNAKFIAPDDQNPDDETVLRVPLPVPLQKGESVAVEIEFENAIPRVIARTGRKDDFLLMAHWYPALGVYEKRADGTWGWNTHQFHVNTEFFHEYGMYDVTLVLPLRYEGKIGATGRMVDGPFKTNDTVRYRFVQNDVHNFAWTVDTNFVVERRKFIADEAARDPKFAAERDRIAKATGLTPEELKLTDVDITILLQSEHADQVDRHYRATLEGLRWYGLWYGRYPYETLTVVDPHYGSNAGGMEYPTLFTAGTRIAPSTRQFTPEGVTIHEFGHQHFYALIGSNEFEHAWMDEGMNTYSTGRTLAMAYGDEWTATSIGPAQFDGRPLLDVAQPVSGLERVLTLQGVAWPTLRESRFFDILPDDPGLRWWRQLPFLNFAPERVSPLLRNRAGYLGRGAMADRIDRHSYSYVDGSAYVNNSYYKPATIFHTLERIVGPEKWARVMRAYGARYRFQHPRPDDYFSTLKEFAGSEIDGTTLDHFIQQTFRGTDQLDYAVDGVANRELQMAKGWFGRGDARKLVLQGDTPASGDKALFESEFVVKRLGGIDWPVEVEWKREGETPQREKWDGRERWWRKRLPPGPKLEWVRVDPDQKLFMDANFLNNNYFVEGDGRPALKYTLRALLNAQSQLQFFGSIR